MASDDCDQFSLIPEGCSNCGDKAEEFCDSKEGKLLNEPTNRKKLIIDITVLKQAIILFCRINIEMLVV